MTGTLHEDQYTFVILSHWIRLSMKMFQEKVVEKTKHTFYV